jgi:hypothetical protein
MNRQEREAVDRRMITVCRACLRASCWQGQHPCERAAKLTSTRMPARTLRKLLLEAPHYWESEQADRVASSGEHAHEKSAREDEPAKLGHLAVRGQPVKQSASDHEQHGNQSDHGVTPNRRSVPRGGK